MADHDNGDDKSLDPDSDSWNIGGEETQIFESQPCDSASLFGDKCNGDTDQLNTLQSTIPFDDTVMREYEMATQAMDLDETQVVDLDATQVVNLDTEFEEMDILDETQLFNDYYDAEEVINSDHEGTEKTEIVDDSDEFSDQDSCRRERVPSTHHSKADTTKFKPETDYGRSEQHTSGDGYRKFTSIRSASIRAAGQAALKKASKSSKSPSGRSLGSEPDTEHRRKLFRRSQSHDLKKTNKSTVSLETGSKYELGRSTARKLFAEDPLAETKQANDNYDFGGAANSPAREVELVGAVGLSYLDSQEPGDASQANALDFVDNFLKVNNELDDGCDVRKPTGGKSKPALSAKGAQNFAKSASLINEVDKRRIFDWDDNLEDEGGGEFFKKKKEVFFASGGRRLKSFTSSKSSKKLGLSDSKLVLGESKDKDKSKKSLGTTIKDLAFRKNLINELDKQSTEMPGGKDAHETTDVQFETQMAAEAMEETGHDSPKTNAGCNPTRKGYCRSQFQPLSSNVVRTTRSKSKMSGGQSKEVMKAKSDVKKIDNFDNSPSDVTNRTERKTPQRRKLDTVDGPVTPVDHMPAKKQCIQYVTPVARRTRQQSMRRNEPDQRRWRKLSSTRKEAGIQSTSRVTRSKVRTLTEQEKELIRESSEKNHSAATTPVGRQPQSASRVTRLKGGTLTEQENEFIRESGEKNHSVATTPVSRQTQSTSRVTRSKGGTLTKQEKEFIRESGEKNHSVATTPVSRQTPVKEPSPICKGDEYLKQSCRRSSLIQEVSSLSPTGSLAESPNKDAKQRIDVSLIRVKFSRHLNVDILKQQQKILSRLGASKSSSVSDATHFIADEFVRTRNMLEAIALGKPVVTHLWLESCGKACCHIDEKNFILRDSKKEKEIGFSLPASLARARQNPLLKGQRVLITPNTKPGKEILSTLVKAVHGLAVERLGRSFLNNDTVPEGLLILSCEEDYAVCLPFLEKGAAIYSSELILNGIVTQRLEYERHRLFSDHVKRTRSTIWLKKDDKYKPVGKVR